jgi:polar amino acid transport system substrate-binding protein
MLLARRWVLSCALGCAAVAVPAAELTLHYQERAPYSSLEADGSVSGLVATPAARALTAAGVAFRWERTPAQRQLALIQHGDGLHCGIGWFRNAEREALGRFNHRALYRDQPFAALVRAGPAWGDSARAADAIATTSARLLVKDGYSYGALLDRLIAAAPAPPVRTSVDPDAMARIVTAGRADWMLVSPDEAPALLARARTPPGALRLIRLDDVPAGEGRHLYCNRAVPAEWLARVDDALAAASR